MGRRREAFVKEKIWTEEELKRVSSLLEGKDPREVLSWVVDNFETKAFALACSLGAIVLLDMLVKIKPDARIFYIDTGLHFRETLEMKEKVEEKYGITIERYTAKMTLDEMEREYGPELWKRDPDMCCKVRKVTPLKEVLAGLKLWITGIRRDQSLTRANTPVVGRDQLYGLIKVSPLASWSSKDMWDYIAANDVPYNALIDKGYPSVGCEPCTEQVKPGEDQRSGRWADSEKTECGLHKQD
jgi:phosphoadenosine phosphosulfate reductase